MTTILESLVVVTRFFAAARKFIRPIYGWWLDRHHKITIESLGEFPGFLPRLIQELNKAQDSICIACDVPGYACFSSPAAHLEYQKALKRICANIKKAEFYFADENVRTQRFEEMFFTGNKVTSRLWERKIAEAPFKQKVEAFLQQHSSFESIPDNFNHNDFKRELERYQSELLAGAPYKDCSPRSIHHRFPIHFWIIDNKTAVFSFPQRENIPSELGFLSSDRRWIACLREMATWYGVAEWDKHRHKKVK